MSSDDAKIIAVIGLGYDPEADPAEALREYGIVLRRREDLPRADAIVAAVAHKQYQSLGLEEIGRKIVRNGCFIDVKAGFDGAAFARAGLAVWRL
jgi:UDP-N-acetyl-D-galactosamine dehydrogenase